jgi:aminopeptidase N
MKDATPQPIRLSDYRPPNHLVDSAHLTFRLNPKATRVLSRIAFRPNPAGLTDGDLRLDGEKLRLIRCSIDGKPLTALDYLLTPEGLTVPSNRLPKRPFTWEAEVEIDPEANTALEGLYVCQRHVLHPVRGRGVPQDHLLPRPPRRHGPFKVRIESDLPVLLSNGNPTASGKGWAEWDDPWPKPAYLFALVAGDLVAHRDSFTTASGKPVDLAIWVRPGDEDKCAYAMDALKRSMRWDEEVYGREYDLDVFNIVAVDDFNMGAMENKGLNIFNSKYVLASPETATDRDYDFIEAIIAHEYFHNWTGNRITCRDWFQLCLKEGLTVFRDQQFSADMRSAPVKRIDDVLTLRARQFREDAGPLAHNVRPESYIEINNFYTATVYEKGAEVIRMLRLVGAKATTPRFPSISTAMTGRPARSRTGSGVRGRHRPRPQPVQALVYPGRHPERTTSPRPRSTRGSSPTPARSTPPAATCRRRWPGRSAPPSRPSTTASIPVPTTVPTPDRPPRDPCATPASACCRASKAPTAPAPSTTPRAT